MSRVGLSVSRDQEIIEGIEHKIKSNQFKTKEELARYITNLKQRGLLNVDDKTVKKLLGIYDQMHTQESLPLDMENYASVGLENQNLIVSKKEDRVLKTMEGTSAFTQEFQQAQNEMIAGSKDGLANADTVFQEMATYKKEEMTLIPLTEISSKDNISGEILMKIKFFVTNKYVDPRLFKVNTETGVFYSIETHEAYEVKKNLNTNQYEIHKGTEKVYGTSTEESQEIISEQKEEEMSYEDRKNKPKVRARTLQPSRYFGNAAFTKIGFLILNIITFTLLTIMTILLIK